jgi:hypothetical protein
MRRVFLPDASKFPIDGTRNLPNWETSFLAQPLSSIELLNFASPQSLNAEGHRANLNSAIGTTNPRARSATTTELPGVGISVPDCDSLGDAELPSVIGGISEVFSYSVQTVLLRFARNRRTPPVFNAVITRFFDIPRLPALMPLAEAVFHS